MMLDENVAALERVSRELGFTDEDLRKLRKEFTSNT